MADNPDDDDNNEAEVKKKGPSPIIIGAAGAFVMALVSFAGIYFLLPKQAAQPSAHSSAERGTVGHDKSHEKRANGNGPSTYYDLEPMIISLGPGGSARHLRIAITLEIAESDYDAFDHAMPRVKDVLNTYLRAVQVNDLENPASMARLRAQILRRLRLVTGDIDIRTLLITEYLLS